MPQEAIREMLRVFERFPNDDGAGVFWSIVHGLEALPDYEVEVLTSVRRVPSDMGVTMLGRLLNAGCNDINGMPIRAILQEVITRSDAVAKQRRCFLIGPRRPRLGTPRQDESQCLRHADGNF